MTGFKPHRFLPGFLQGILKNTGLFLVLGLMGTSNLWAESGFNWESLDLSSEQAQTIDQLEDQWRATYSRLYPQIEQDRRNLRQVIHAPESDERSVMMIQNRLHKNEDYLREEATRIFMKKKSLLTSPQRQKLHKMMPPAATR